MCFCLINHQKSWNSIRKFGIFYRHQKILAANSLKILCISFLTFPDCFQRSQIDHRLGGIVLNQSDQWYVDCTSIQVDSDSIIPVDHFHLDFWEGGQERGWSIGGSKAERCFVSVGVHHSLGIHPKPSSAHVSLVLCEHHLQIELLLIEDKGCI